MLAPHRPTFQCNCLHGAPELVVPEDGTDGQPVRRESELCPQFIKLSAVCNSKMQIGTESVICPEFETSGAGGQPSMKGSREVSNPPAMQGPGGQKFCGRIQPLTQPATGCNRTTMHWLAEFRQCLDLRRSRSQMSRETLSSAFSCGNRHLQNRYDASDESWSRGGGVAA